VHFPWAAVAASETSTVAVSASPVAVSTPERASSVIKTHFCFTSAYSGYISAAIKIRSYTILLLKTKMKFLITDYMTLYFYCQFDSRSDAI
jgi:hypothetical protein